MLTGFLLTSYLSSCGVIQSHWPYGSRDHAYIHYWPVLPNNKQMRLAVKDNIDMKGVVTSSGSEYLIKNNPPASTDADCLATARKRNVRIVGKTNLSEFCVAPSGLNDYFGTPKNPFNKQRRLIPGGSSSGSAVAVANGSADVAFGTDTAGSIRVPAACCGVVGLKTTFGLISNRGVVPIEPTHLDTVGPMGKDVAHVVQGMDLLQNGFETRYRTAVAAKPSAKKIKIVGKVVLIEARVLAMQNTVAVNLAGNPALAIPIPVHDRNVPVTSLQLVGPQLSEATLLNAGRLIEAER
jgi:amidase